MIEVFRARAIVTMDPTRPLATHVAVDDGRIVAVGEACDADGWGAAVDERYADCVIMPGLVEGHGHIVTGGIWDFVYVGAHPRPHPDGAMVDGIRDNAAVVARMKAERQPGKPVIGWGFDPIFVTGPNLSRRELDQVDSTVPVVVLHSNLHLMTVNSVALEMVGYSCGQDICGLVTDDTGEPTGVLREFAAMFPVMRRLGIDIDDLANSERALDRYGRLCTRAGVTTATDLLNGLPDDAVALMNAYTAADDCPIRLIVALNALGGKAEDIGLRAKALAPRSTERLRLGMVKVMTDGSLQGYTAQLRTPYLMGNGDPMWNIAPEQLNQLVSVLHGEKLQMHLHANGDLAVEVVIEALEAAVAKHPVWEHRHIIQHFQVGDEMQLRRVKAIGAGVNIFANHVYFFGDRHVDTFLGPERAATIDPCGSARRVGVHMAVHSDTPVTPLAPLFTAGVAINRQTESGKVLGPAERLSVMDALHAITLDAAWTLKMETEIGSIEAGKYADFAILADNPLEVGPAAIGAIKVLGTVSGGRHFQA
jgi:predicted amidohydrolase YtcJ